MTDEPNSPPPAPENPPPAPGPASPQPAPAAAGGPVAEAPMATQKNWALAAHLTTLTNFIGIPGFIGPLIIWLVKKDEMPFASRHAKEALNFQISMFIYGIVAAVLVLVFIGILLLIALGIFAIVVAIIAAVRAGEGQDYSYPLTIRLIS